MSKHKFEKIIYPVENISFLKKLPAEEQVLKILAERSYSEYIRQSWHILEPKKEIIWGWHLDAISEHLEAVTRNEIKYLIINIPPRHTKSITVTVAWPTWLWGPIRKPGKRILASSYSLALSIRDCRKSRTLIQSQWYQKNWGSVFHLAGDQNAKSRYDNDKQGYRIATSVGGVTTGEGGDVILCDDPHNVLEAESDTKRNEVNIWWDEAMSSRLDDEENGAYIIIAQRTHYNDLCGHIIEKAEVGEIEGLVTLILPWRYEKERELTLQTRTPLPSYFEKKYKQDKISYLKSIGEINEETNLEKIDKFDPRTEEGELLHKDRFTEKSAKEREGRMTSYSRAGQLAQRPSPRGGGMFKIENFIPIKEIPPWRLVKKAVRYWDKAGTEGGGCMSAGVKMYEMDDTWNGPKFIITDVEFGHWSSATRNLRMKQVAELDGKEVWLYTEQEPGSGGKESAETTIRSFFGYKVFADKVSGSKVSRADPYSAQVEGNNVGYVINIKWNKEFLDQHEKFPTGSYYKDIVDAASGSFAKLTLIKRKKAGTLRR